MHICLYRAGRRVSSSYTATVLSEYTLHYNLHLSVNTVDRKTEILITFTISQAQSHIPASSNDMRIWKEIISHFKVIFHKQKYHKKIETDIKFMFSKMLTHS